MGNPSPRQREKPGRRTPDLGAGNAGLLVVVALLGLILLAATAWIFLSNATPSDAPTTRVAPPVAARVETSSAPADVDLARRIAAEVERRRAPTRLSIPILAPDGEPASAVGHVVLGGYEPPSGRSPGDPSFAVTVDGTRAPLCLLVPGSWPELARLDVQAEELALVRRRRIVLPAPPSPAGEVALEPIELSPGIRVSGRVVAAGGGPAADVVVQAFPLDPERPGEAGVRTVLGTKRTDAQGGFTLDHLGARAVRLETSGARGSANGVVAEIAAASPPVTITLAAPARVAGRVVDSRGDPIAGATLQARMAGPEELSGEVARSDSDSSSEAAGSFTLDHLAPGYYVVTCDADGYAPRTLPRVHTDVSDLRVTLHALAAANVELLGAPAGLEIPVTWRALAPGASGDPERPLDAPRLSWLRDGKLVIRGIAPGVQALELSVPGAMAVVTPVVEFAADSTTELGTFTLTAGATITASVRGPDGAPLAARVALAARHHTTLALARDVFDLPDRLEQTVGSDGKLAWSGLPPGPRVLAFRHPGFADRRVKVTIPASGTLALEPVTLEPSGTLEGELRRRGGAPASEVEITATRIGGATLSTTTDLDGRYRFPRLAPGRYELTILRVDEDAPLDGTSVLTPRPNVTRLVDVPVGEPVRCDLTVDPD